MFPVESFENVCKLPMDKQKALIDLAMEKSLQIETLPLKQLQDICSEKDAKTILEYLVYLSYLCKRNNTERFLELTQRLGVPGRLTMLYVQDSSRILQLPPAYNYKWRIDISVPKANAILMNICLRDGDVLTFRLDSSTFHKFRFNVALLIKELNALKKKYTTIKKF